jgi:putative inorganic carbon (HCO3(-)) transporter
MQRSSNLKKFSYPILFAVLLVFSVGFAFIIKVGEIKATAMIFIGVAGPLIAYGTIAYPKFGVITLLVIAYLIQMVMRMNLTSFPLGTIMDGMYVLLIIGFYIQQKYEPDWEFMKSPISIMIVLWIGYNFVEVLNPSAASRMAWIYTIRTLAIVMVTYFIFSYAIRDVKSIRLILKIWIGLSFFGAAWGFKQQFFGFTGYEEAYLYSDPLIANLLFINGIWRKFSIYSDPTAFSYNMIISSLLCIGIMFGPISKTKKWILGFLVFFFLLNMLFAGTRSAYVLIPAGLAMLTVLVFNRKILMISGIAGILLGILIIIPTGNVTLYRFQSAFKPSNDASFNVRAANQKFIQPYIRSHPMGGGLGATGVWGAKFSPESFLSKFPPDSGYVRIGVELGWFGLLLFCTLMYMILYIGINNYYAIKDPELKSYCMAMVLITFAINIGNYPQEAITQFPLSVYFFLVAALINITLKLDKEKTKRLLTESTTDTPEQKYHPI